MVDAYVLQYCLQYIAHAMVLTCKNVYDVDITYPTTYYMVVTSSPTSVILLMSRAYVCISNT